ncbi:MAG TPA: arginine--tRNA ligase, partial [Puia sp.]|nr:arginine--tRNA ligase [Puia sp.]
MDIISQIKAASLQVLSTEFRYAPEGDITVNETKPEFDGDYTIVLFALVKQLKQSAEALGAVFGQALIRDFPGLIAGFNVIKGFLNLTIADSQWLTFLAGNYGNDNFGRRAPTGQRVMIEYSSP